MKKSTADDEAKIPQMLGFRFQIEFCKTFCNSMNIIISYKKVKDEGTQDLRMQCYGSCEEVIENQHDILFDLPITHPVIDCVGVFTHETKQKWLVFFQMSLCEYVRHARDSLKKMLH